MASKCIVSLCAAIVMSIVYCQSDADIVPEEPAVELHFASEWSAHVFEVSILVISMTIIIIVIMVCTHEFEKAPEYRRVSIVSNLDTPE